MHLLDFFRSAPLHERLLSSDAARNPVLNWAIRHHTGLIVVGLIAFVLAWQCFIYPACAAASVAQLISQLLFAATETAGAPLRSLVCPRGSDRFKCCATSRKPLPTCGFAET